MKRKMLTGILIAGGLVCLTVICLALFTNPVVIPFTGERTGEPDGEIRMTARFPVYDESCEYMTVIIENGSSEVAEFGEAWYLEKYVLGSWMDVPRKEDYVVVSILRILNPGGKYAFDCRLTGFIGDIEKGRYRIIKEINGSTYTAEFEIGESEITAESPFGYEPAARLGYDKVRADRDGACGLYEDEIVNEDRLIAFLEETQVNGLQAQIRLYTRSDDGKMYYTDIVKLKHPVYRVTTWEQDAVDAVRLKLFSSSDINAFGEYKPKLEELIQVHYYDSLVTDGKAVWLSAYSDLRDIAPDKDDLCIVPEKYASDAVKDWIKNSFAMQTEELTYSVWNKDGSRKASAKMESEFYKDWQNTYFISIYNDYGYSTKGYTCGIQNGIFEMNKDGGIREFLWTDEKTVMMRAEDGKGNYYYEFYDTEEEKRLSYTVTENGYRIENGEVIIEE